VSVISQIFADDIFSRNLGKRYVDPSGRAVQAVGLRLFACWDFEFKSRRKHRCLSLECVVCGDVETCEGSVTRSRVSCRVWCV